MKLEKTVPKACHVDGILDLNPQSIKIHRSTSEKKKLEGLVLFFREVTGLTKKNKLN